MPSETQACLDDIGVCLPSKGDLTNATSRKPVRIDLKDGSARRKLRDIGWMLDTQWQYPYMDTAKVSRHPSSPIQGVSTCRPEEVGGAVKVTVPTTGLVHLSALAGYSCGSSMILGGHVAHAVMCKQWAHHVTATHHTTHVAVCSAGGSSSDGGWACRWMAWRHK